MKRSIRVITFIIVSVMLFGHTAETMFFPAASLDVTGNSSIFNDTNASNQLRQMEVLTNPGVSPMSKNWWQWITGGGNPIMFCWRNGRWIRC